MIGVNSFLRPNSFGGGYVTLDYTSPTWSLRSFQFATDNIFTGDSTASTIVNNAIVGASKQFTFSMWVKRTVAGVTQILFCRDNSTTAVRQFSAFFGNTNKFTVSFFTNSTNSITYTSTASFTETREWNQFTVVYDGTQSATSRITVYRNGIAEAGSTAQTGTFTTINNTSANNIEIGGRSNSANYSSSKINQLSFFNTNLSAANVLALHNDRVPFDVRTNTTLNSSLVLFVNADQSAMFSTNWSWTDLKGGAVFTSSGMVSGDRVDDAPALKQISLASIEGQSNASGREDKLVLPTRFSGVLSWIKFWNTNTMEDSNTATDNNQYFDTQANSEYGIEYYLGELLNLRYRKTIYFFKVAQGGSYLANNSPSWSRNPAGNVYSQFITDITALKEWELANGYTITKIRFIWIQGEADSLVEAYANAYQASFSAWLTGSAGSVFDRFNSLFYITPKLYDCLLSANQTDPDLIYKATVNTAKTNVQALDTTNRRLINTDDAGVSAVDLVHYNDAGNLTIATKIDAAIALDGF
jgi:hypothetical protein